MPGGLKENVYWFLGESVFIRQIEGEKHMYEYLEKNKNKIAEDKTPYLFIDALNCGQGCLYGTGIEPEKERRFLHLESGQMADLILGVRHILQLLFIQCESGGRPAQAICTERVLRRQELQRKRSQIPVHGRSQHGCGVQSQDDPTRCTSEERALAVRYSGGRK